MLSLSDNNQTDTIEAFNSTSSYLDDLLNIDNSFFEQMVGQIYPTELQLNKANSSDTRAYPGSEFVVANTIAIWKKLEPNEINFSQGFSQKVVSASCFVFNSAC